MKQRGNLTKIPAGNIGLNTKYIIVIESKHKQFIFMKIRARQITFRTNVISLCKLLSLLRNKICRLITKHEISCCTDVKETILNTHIRANLTIKLQTIQINYVSSGMKFVTIYSRFTGLNTTPSPI